MRRMVNRPAQAAILLASLALCAGCQLIHGYETVTVTVRDVDTNQPVAGASVGIAYLYMLDPFAPDGSAGNTDANGKVRLELATRTSHATIIQSEAPGYLRQEIHLGQHKGGPDIGEDEKPVREYLVYLFSGKPTVDLIFPNDFRGLVRLDFVPLAEKDWVAGQRRFPVQVPASGLAELKGPAPLLEHQIATNIEGHFVDGTRLNSAVKDDDPAIGLRWLVCTNDAQFFVVGTSEDYEIAKNIVYRRIDTFAWTTDYDSIAAWTKHQKDQK